MAYVRLQSATTSVTFASAVTTADITLTYVQPGSLIVSAISVDKDSGTITIPTGFTRIGSDYIGASVSHSAAYKIATGGEITITWSWVTSHGVSMWAGVYRGVTGALDQYVQANSANAVVTSLASGDTSATTTVGELGLFMLAGDSHAVIDGTRTWSNGFTEIAWVNGGGAGDPAMGVAEKSIAALGAQSSTFGCTDTGDQMALTLAAFPENKFVETNNYQRPKSVSAGVMSIAGIG